MDLKKNSIAKDTGAAKASGRTVLVTGAAGTVGQEVVNQCLKAGYQVIATDVREDGLVFDGAAAVEVRGGDLTDLAFCLKVVRGAHLVIHTAATVDLALPVEVQQRINNTAVQYLFEAARAEGVKRFVHFSSGSIYQRQDTPLEESTPFEPYSPYEQSKVDAERYLWSRPREGTELTVLRPTMIYGPRGRFLGARLACMTPILALFLRKIPVIEGGPLCNWVHAEDVARAAVFVLEHKEAAWQAFNVADDTVLAFGEVMNAVTRAYGLPFGPRIKFPTAIMKILGATIGERELFLKAATIGAQRLWRGIRQRYGLSGPLEPAVDREVFSYATITAIFDNKRLKALGFDYKYKSLTDGFPSVLKWYQDAKWAPRYQPTADSGGRIGFQFAETMAGTWDAPENPEQPFSFTVTAATPSIWQFTDNGLLSLDGTVTASGLCEQAPCNGTLDMSFWQRTLVYDLSFPGNDGNPYRFRGKKNVRLLSPLDTLTHMPGTIEDPNGNVVGNAIVHFDLGSELLPMVRSLALRSATTTTNA